MKNAREIVGALTQSTIQMRAALAFLEDEVEERTPEGAYTDEAMRLMRAREVVRESMREVRDLRDEFAKR